MTLIYLDLLLQLKIKLSQNDINFLLECFSKWQMSFYVTKCKFMTGSRISDVKHYTMNTPSVDFSIPATDQEIDLGVVFEHNLKFTNHVS